MRVRIRTADGSEQALALGLIAQRLLLDPALTLRVLQQLAEWVHQREAAVAGGVQAGGSWTGGWIPMDDLAPLLRTQAQT